MSTPIEKLRKWIKAERGRLTSLASELQITPAAINQWDVVPADKVVRISNFTGIRRSDLRPDLYAGMVEAAQ